MNDNSRTAGSERYCDRGAYPLAATRDNDSAFSKISMFYQSYRLITEIVVRAYEPPSCRHRA